MEFRYVKNNITFLFILFIVIQNSCKKVIISKAGESSFIVYKLSNNVIINKVVQLRDGGFIMVGEAHESGQLSSASYDGWLARTDAHGNLLWSKTYGGVRADGLKSVVENLDGSFIACGYTASYGNALSNPTSQTPDGWILKLDANGRELWSKSLGGGNNTHDFNGQNEDKFFDISLAPNGNMLLCGVSTSFKDTMVSGGVALAGWIVEVEDSGKLKWEIGFFEPGKKLQNCFTQMILKPGRILTSYIHPTNAVISWNYSTPGVKPQVEYIAQCTRGSQYINSDINRQDIAELSNGDILVTSDDVKEIDSIYLCRFDASGNQLLFKYIESDGNAFFKNSVITNQGLLITGGYRKTHLDLSQALLLYTDFSGRIIWEKRFNQVSEMSATAVHLDQDGHIMMFGNMIDQLNGRYQVFLLKLSEKGEMI